MPLRSYQALPSPAPNARTTDSFPRLSWRQRERPDARRVGMEGGRHRMNARILIGGALLAVGAIVAGPAAPGAAGSTPPGARPEFPLPPPTPAVSAGATGHRGNHRLADPPGTAAAGALA